jgi:hypothetical protein
MGIESLRQVLRCRKSAHTISDLFDKGVEGAGNRGKVVQMSSVYASESDELLRNNHTPLSTRLSTLVHPF